MLFGVATVALLLLAAEAALRLGRVAETPRVPPSPVTFQKQGKVHLVVAPHRGRRWLLAGGTNPRPRLRRPAGLRVVVLGGSAVAGAPLNPLVSFSSWLQRYLVRLFPGRPVEVVNHGFIGLSSHQMVELVANDPILDHADLAIIYSGNNEFFQLRARKLALSYYEPRLELLRHRLWSLRLYRLLARFKPPSRQPSIEANISTRTFKVPVTEADRQLALLLYRANLAALADQARRRKVPLLLVTVADNWRRGAPGGEVLQSDLRRAKGQNPAELSPRALTQQWAAALSEEVTDHSVSYLLATALLEADAEQQARQWFLRAEYLSPNPHRSNSQMRSALLELAREHRVASCDAASELASLSPAKIPGEDVFVDWCHPNPLGHVRLAQIITRCIAQHRLLPIPEEADLETAMVQAAASLGDRYRLDLYMKPFLPRHLPFASPPPPRADADGDALKRANAGFKAFVLGMGRKTGQRSKYLRQAAQQLDLALSSGGPAGVLQYSRALVALYDNDLAAALAAAHKAAAQTPGDPDVSNLARVLGLKLPGK